MKRFSTVSTAVFLLLTLALPLQQAFAATRIYCEFKWPENRDLNVKSSYDMLRDLNLKNSAVVKNYRLIVDKKVRTKEYNRLACPWATTECWTTAQVRADRGAKCNLRHPENARIDIDIRKDNLRYMLGDKIPDCADLNAQVRCTGNPDVPVIFPVIRRDL